MTSEVSNRAAVYGDFAGLQKLKTSVRGNDPNALRQVAQQFESLFARMMIKSMRKAIGSDPIFGSDQAQTYQGMFDDQLSLELTRGRGLGLTDMLMRQLHGASAATAAGSHASSTTSPTASAGAAARPPGFDSRATRTEFVRALWPQARQAADQLGVHPVSLIAQAALESNWGRAVPRSSTGDSSHNLFGIKATNAWGGNSDIAPTREFHNGDALSVRAAFRAYADPAAGFQDYVALLGRDPRYREALNSGSDIGAFARALQKGGYATDPDYASKVTAVAREISALLATPASPAGELKFADSRPITVGTAAL